MFRWKCFDHHIYFGTGSKEYVGQVWYCTVSIHNRVQSSSSLGWPHLALKNMEAEQFFSWGTRAWNLASTGPEAWTTEGSTLYTHGCWPIISFGLLFCSQGLEGSPSVLGLFFNYNICARCQDSNPRCCDCTVYSIARCATHIPYQGILKLTDLWLDIECKSVLGTSSYRLST